MSFNLKKTIKIIILTLLFGALFAHAAWQNPTTTPTGNNVLPPLFTVTSNPQYKIGSFTIGTSLGIAGQGFLQTINDIIAKNFYAIGSTANNGEIQGRYLYSFASPWSAPLLGSGLPQVGDVYANRFCLSNFSGGTNCTTGPSWNLGVLGTMGQTLRYSAPNVIQANSNVFNNPTTNNVGIGTTTPGAKLEVAGGSVRSTALATSTVRKICVQPDGTIVSCPTVPTGPTIYSTAGTYSFTVPQLIDSSFMVRIWGAGGGGGGGFVDETTVLSASGWCEGNGGGAGEYRVLTDISNLIPNSIVTVTVGNHGLGGAVVANGTNGGNSSFGTLVTAKGGFKGTHGAEFDANQPINPTSLGGGQTGNTGGSGGTAISGSNGTFGGCIDGPSDNPGAGGSLNNGYGAGGQGGFIDSLDYSYTSSTNGTDGRVEIWW